MLALDTISKFDRMEAAIATLPPANIETVHNFFPGLYVRELRIPAFTLLTGRIHRLSCANVVCGDISVFNDETGEETRYIGSSCFESPANTRRVGFTHMPTIWRTLHVTNETDLNKIEADFIVQHENLLMNGRAL